jgi:phosphoribosylglycinamide formyltransferase-1
MTLPIGVLVSGRGTNLQAILNACADGTLAARVVFVASNRDGVPALIRASRAGVAHAAFTIAQYGSRGAAQAAMADALVAAGVRLMVHAGFDHILGPEYFVRLGSTPIINVHPALLPLFGGKGMYGDRVHAAVLAAGAKETGVTVHRVHPDTIDLGEVIVQRRVRVEPGDDVPTLAARVLAEEHKAIVEAIRTFAAA